MVYSFIENHGCLNSATFNGTKHTALGSEFKTSRVPTMNYVN